MRKQQDNYAFIDSQNLNLSIRRQGWILDFGKFRRYLQDKYGVTKAFLFIGYVYDNQGLYIDLQKHGYIVVFKPTLTLPDGSVKGNVDAELVLHTMIEYENFEKALIVTGDGDFYCLVDHLIKKGKLLKLMVPDKNRFSSLFRRVMSHLVFMNSLKDKLERR
ncbi:MAG: NYN domain-containing protein [Chloroflexi bacterium]|nr:NYN domain-containing protein [Chloroflexota bacterium]